MSVTSESLSAFIATLNGQEVRYSELDSGTLRIGWGASPVDFVQYVSVQDLREGLARVNVHLVPAMSIPASLRKDVGAFLGRVNWDIALGNWELDVDDGQVLFRISTVIDQPLSLDLADYYLGASRWHRKRTMPFLMRMVNDGFTCDEAFLDYLTEGVEATEAEVEADPDSD